jgi:hypothetical protein
MRLSTCCGAETDMDEMGICPECLEHSDFEDEDEDEDELEQDRQTENQIEQEQINKHLN